MSQLSDGPENGTAKRRPIYPAAMMTAVPLLVRAPRRTGLLALALLASAGCPANDMVTVDAGDSADAAPAQPDAASVAGTVTFQYVLLNAAGGGGPEAAIDCAAAGPGVAAIRLLVGNDGDGNAELDDTEVQAMAEATCNQADTNANETLEVEEFGSYLSMDVPAGDYDLFAVEVVSLDSTRVPWQTFDVNANRERFSYGGGLTVAPAPAVTSLPFAGEGQFAEELQIYLGF